MTSPTTRPLATFLLKHATGQTACDLAVAILTAGSRTDYTTLRDRTSDTLAGDARIGRLLAANPAAWAQVAYVTDHATAAQVHRVLDDDIRPSVWAAAATCRHVTADLLDRIVTDGPATAVRAALVNPTCSAATRVRHARHLLDTDRLDSQDRGVKAVLVQAAAADWTLRPRLDRHCPVSHNALRSVDPDVWAAGPVELILAELERPDAFAGASPLQARRFQQALADHHGDAVADTARALLIGHAQATQSSTMWRKVDIDADTLLNLDPFPVAATTAVADTVTTVDQVERLLPHLTGRHAPSGAADNVALAIAGRVRACDPGAVPLDRHAAAQLLLRLLIALEPAARPAVASRLHRSLREAVWDAADADQRQRLRRTFAALGPLPDTPAEFTQARIDFANVAPAARDTVAAQLLAAAGHRWGQVAVLDDLAGRPGMTTLGDVIAVADVIA